MDIHVWSAPRTLRKGVGQILLRDRIFIWWDEKCRRAPIDRLFRNTPSFTEQRTSFMLRLLYTAGANPIAVKENP